MYSLWDIMKNSIICGQLVGKKQKNYFILLDTAMLGSMLFALMRTVDAIMALCPQRMIFVPTVAKVVLFHSTILA